MMAHEKANPVGAVDNSMLRRTRRTPSRTGGTDLGVGQDEHAMLQRKLRGLRGGAGASDDSINYVSEGHEGGDNIGRQERDDKDRLGSNRSIKSEESVITAATGNSGDSVLAGSFAVYGGSTPKAAPKVSSNVPPAESPTSGHGISRTRGLSRRTGGAMMSSIGSQINPVSGHSITQTNLPEASEHSTSSLGLSSHLNGPRGRARGLGGRRQISTTRVVEPSQAPMVSALGTVSPLVGKAPSRRINGSGSSHGTISSASTSSRTSRTIESMPMRSPIPLPGPPRAEANDSGVVAEQQMLVVGSVPSQQRPGSMHAQTRSDRHPESSTAITNRSSRGANQHGGSRLGTRGRQQGSATSNRRLPAHIQEAQQLSMNAARNATGNALPAQVQEAQEQSLRASRAPYGIASREQGQEAQEQEEALYQPTQEDWAKLYKRHVEELERKDLEIAMKVSSMPGVGQQEEEEAQNSPNEEEMLRLALEISRNDDNSTFQNNLDGGLGNNASANGDCSGYDDVLNIPYPSQQAKGPDEDSDLERALRLSAEQPQRQVLSEEEELERILRLSQEEAEQAVQPAQEEDEELLRILRMSQMQHEEEQKKQQELAEQGQSDEELQRILQLSQQEATDVDKERETMELVLKLSQIGEL